MDSEFVKKLYELCREHKVNLRVELESDDEKYSHYEITITGAWDILKTQNAVNVYGISRDDFIMSLKGTK